MIRVKSCIVNIVLVLVMVLGVHFPSYTQTDTEFWFSMPEVNRYHFGGTSEYPTPGWGNLGTPVYLHLTSFDKPANITISMPANAANFNGGSPIVVNLPANTTQRIDLSPFVGDNVPGITAAKSIENRLKWTTSSLAPPTPYINRNNKGIRIISDNNITAYFEISVLYNMDLISLKGRNALGKKFYVPFQNTNNTRAYNYLYRPYSSIDIVATEDDTKIKITTTKPIWVKGVGAKAAGTHEIWLNAGQTSIITPYKNIGLIGGIEGYQTSFDAADRLTGAFVEVDQTVGSGGSISVITHDDIVKTNYPIGNTTGNPDYVTDQLVPIDHIGVDYAVIQGVGWDESIATNPALGYPAGYIEIEDWTYIVGTVAGTNLTVKHGPGGPTTNHTVGVGGTVPIDMNSLNSRVITVKADNPVYILHMSGAGRQKAGAIIPTISNCTGSYRVAFNRTKDDPYKFYLNILAWHTGLGKFRLLKNNVPVSTAAELAVINAINNAANFNNLPETGVPYDNWKYARINADGLDAGVAYLLVNDENVFHLGVINGNTANDAFYGYFSNFNQFTPVGTVGPKVDPEIMLCYGDNTQLNADGGAKYSWSPITFLDNPNIRNPNVIFPTTTTKYTVTVQGACNLTGTADVIVNVSPPLSPSFVADTTVGCGNLNVNFTNTSVGNVQVLRWYVENEGDPYPGTLVKTANLVDNPTDHGLTYNFVNSGAAPQTFVVNLLVDAGTCRKVVKKSIKIYPHIDINPVIFSTSDANGCHPLTVNFRANPIGNYGTATFNWDFGDGGTSTNPDPSHTYTNFTNALATFAPYLTITDQYNYCTVTKPTAVVNVQPYIKANFAIDTVQGCSPFSVQVVNNSLGGISSYQWDKDGDNVWDDSSPANWIFSRTNNGAAPITVNLKLRVQNLGGCFNIYNQDVVINPRPTAIVTVNPTGDLNCSPLTVNLQANVTGGTNHKWILDGANTVSNLTTASIEVENNTATVQSHNLVFITQNQYGCDFVSAPVSFNVQPFINAQFAIDNAGGCSPIALNFSVQKFPGISEYRWDWDNSGGAPDLINTPVSQANSFTRNYVNTTNATQTLQPRLTVVNTAGCVRTLLFPNPVPIYPEVTANFAVPPAQCNPHTINFVNQSTYAGGAALVNGTYEWDFGDGSTSIDAAPSHEFINTTGGDKIFDIKLIATSEHGCKSPVLTRQFTLYPFIKPEFSVTDPAGCSPHPFDILLTKYNGITRYQFDVDDDGTYELDYGAGAPLTIPSNLVNNTGLDKIFNVKLRVENYASCFEEITVPVVVHPSVTAGFTPVGPIIGCNPLSVNFASTSVLTGTANLPDYVSWSFGDGASSALTNVTHEFLNTSTVNDTTFTVTLLASTLHGCNDSLKMDVTVHPKLTNGFAMSHSSVCTPFNTTFTPSGVGATSYEWNFGGAIPNETLATGTPFTRLIDNADPDNIQTYTISLVTSNAGGICSTAPETKVLKVYPRLVPQAASNLVFSCPGDVVFSNTSTGGDLVYSWDFDDTQSYVTDLLDNITHTFDNRSSKDSTYNVRMTALNAAGCNSFVDIPVTIHPRVESDFAVSYAEQCTPFEVTFTNASLNGTNFSWDYGYTLGGVPQQESTVRPMLVHTYTFDNDNPNTIINPVVTLTSTQTHVNSGLTCSSVIQKPFIPVYPRIVANFDANVYSGCNPLSVNFNNLSTGLGENIWDMRNGNVTADASPQNVVFTNDKKDQLATFSVKLITTNAIGCKDSIERTVTVNPLVKAEFQWDKFEGCTPLTVDLSNSSTSPLYKYSWDYGDATPKTYAEQPVSHLYTNPTNTPPVILNRTITLRTSYVGDTLCIDSLKLPVRVFPHIFPDFTAPNLAGCHPHNVTFSNQTVAFSSSNSYHWDLGSGVNSINFEPQFEYVNPSLTNNATYTIRLRATSEHGCVDSVKHDVTVYPRPFAAMEINGSYMACPPFDVLMDNNSLGTNLTYYYRFGDGADSTTTNSATMLHTFDNLTSDIQPYQIDLRATTQYNCKDSVSQTVYVYPHVFANYNVAPGLEGCSPFEVNFSNTSINSRFYKWEFDDGVSSSFSSPSHSFLNFNETDKLFNVRLKAWSEYNCVDADTQQITVWATPIADIAVDPPLKVFPDATFNVYNQSNPGAATWSYSWDFNDNTFSILRDPGTHTYLRWGPKENDYKYDIKLKVESPHCKDSTVSTIFLLPAVPEASFVGNIDSACSPLEVHFINTSNWADFYLWDFGDGTTSTEREPIHTFTEPGYYTVKLTVTGDGGVRFFYRVFRVYKNPTAAFAVYPQKVMLPDATIHAYNLSTDFTRSLWDLGDGTTTTDKDPVHTYTKLGEFKVSLWVYMDYDNDVCVDSISKNPAVWVEGIGIVKFPNAFKPNKIGPNGGVYDAIDYKNEVFHPYHQGVTEYKLMVFSRWGEQIFTSDNVTVGWDGYINNKLADQGVYMWRAIGKFTNGKTFDMKGSVTLLR